MLMNLGWKISTNKKLTNAECVHFSPLDCHAYCMCAAILSMYLALLSMYL